MHISKKIYISTKVVLFFLCICTLNQSIAEKSDQNSGAAFLNDSSYEITNFDVSMFDAEDTINTIDAVDITDRTSKDKMNLSSTSGSRLGSNSDSNSCSNVRSSVSSSSRSSSSSSSSSASTLQSTSSSSSSSGTTMANQSSGYKKSAAYRLKNMLFVPQKDYHYEQTGVGSWYGGTDGFDGKKTAIGDIFNKDHFTAAHRTLPIPCVVCLTNLKNGKKVFVIVNDRGPYVRGRLIDVSKKTARMLGFEREGKAYLKIQCIPKLSKIVSKIFAAAQKGSPAASALYYKMKKNGITVKQS